MYENQTEQTILKRMLARLPSSLDKREGSVIYDATMPAAIECMLLYAMADWFLKNTFADTAEREWLVERAKERGLAPYPATAAVVKGIFAPAAIQVPVGTRFSYEAVNYAVTEQIGGGVFLLRCETVGTAGNQPAGKLLAIDYVEGLETAQLAEVIVPGEDEEETEHFRARYLASFEGQAFGGNIADYREKVNAIPGVGGVKVYPVWQGGGTVRVVFMTSEYKVPTAEFVDQVQTAIDPLVNQAQGIGLAPIDHKVTVEGVRDAAVRIGLQLTLTDGYSFEDYRESIEAVIDGYFAELNQGWEGTQKVTLTENSNIGIAIRISQIESRLLEIPGVEDVQHTKLNELEENLVLDPDELAVRGELHG